MYIQNKLTKCKRNVLNVVKQSWLRHDLEKEVSFPLLSTMVLNNKLRSISSYL